MSCATRKIHEERRLRGISTWGFNIQSLEHLEPRRSFGLDLLKLDCDQAIMIDYHSKKAQDVGYCAQHSKKAKYYRISTGVL